MMLIGLVSKMDYDDAVLERDAYCENVKAHVWPDYRGIYRTECAKKR